MYYYLLTRFLVKPQGPHESCASCRKYEGMLNCLAQTAVTPSKNLTCKSNDRICWYSFHVQSRSNRRVLPLLCKLCLTDPSTEAIGRWGEPIGGGAAGYLNSPRTTSSDFSNIILLFCLSTSVPESTERKARDTFMFNLFLFTPSLPRMGIYCLSLHLGVYWCTCWLRKTRRV